MPERVNSGGGTPVDAVGVVAQPAGQRAARAHRGHAPAGAVVGVAVLGPSAVHPGHHPALSVVLETQRPPGGVHDVGHITGLGIAEPHQLHRSFHTPTDAAGSRGNTAVATGAWVGVEYSQPDNPVSLGVHPDPVPARMDDLSRGAISAIDDIDTVTVTVGHCGQRPLHRVTPGPQPTGRGRRGEMPAPPLPRIADRVGTVRPPGQGPTRPLHRQHRSADVDTADADASTSGGTSATCDRSRSRVNGNRGVEGSASRGKSRIDQHHPVGGREVHPASVVHLDPLIESGRPRPPEPPA